MHTGSFVCILAFNILSDCRGLVTSPLVELAETFLHPICPCLLAAVSLFSASESVSFCYLVSALSAPTWESSTRRLCLSAVVGTCPCPSDGPETWLLSVGGDVRWGVGGGGRSPSFPPSRCFSKAVRPAPTRGRGSVRKEQASSELLRLLPLQGPLIGRVPKPLVRDSPEERDQRDGAGRQAGDAGRSCGLRPSARGRPPSLPSQRARSFFHDGLQLIGQGPPHCGGLRVPLKAY